MRVKARPVCCAVGVDANPLAVAPHQSPLWLTGKAKARKRSTVRAGELWRVSLRTAGAIRAFRVNLALAPQLWRDKYKPVLYVCTVKSVIFARAVGR